MSHVFTYGSLMFKTVWNLVAQGEYEKSDATLANYIRRAVINQEYPAVLPQIDPAGVDGILYFNVTDNDVLRLDEFEGQFYTRKQEQVMVEKNTPLSAEVYVIKDRYRHIVSENAWDPVHFETTGINRFIQNYTGFHQAW